MFGFGKRKNTVDYVEAMTLTVRGMRESHVYKIAETDGSIELKKYREVYSGGETVLEFQKSASCDTASFIKLINDCGVMCWDGFHGKHPKNIRDGVMFSFKATVNGGQKLYADGSENFPKGYREFVRELNSMLA